MGAGTEKRQSALGYGHKIQLRSPIKYFTKTKQMVCNRPLQTLASLYLYLVWYLWLILFINSIVYHRKMVKSNVIKRRFIQTILFSNVIENR